MTQNSTSTESYTYDPVGNRLSSLGVSSYTNNSSNELTSTSNATYTYDLNGNLLTKVVGSNTTSYAWDYENRMTSVTLPGSGGTVTFAYDPFGRRIKKVTSSATSIFAYDGDNLVEETNASGTAVARYSQGLNIDEPLAMLRGGATSFYHADGLGSVTSLSSAAGSIANTYTYDSFGNLTASTGSVVNPLQYTGRESDAETGLYYYRARYYDPNAGRFLSEDPSDFNGGINFYAYVANNPINWIDPLGLAPLSLGDIANLVAKNNNSGQSDELIICMAYKESTFDPDAMQSGSNSARGLLGVTDAAATDAGFDWADLGDPATNIDAGSTYLGMRIHRNHGNIPNGLAGYGTGMPYARSLLKCEKCLISHEDAKDECKTKDCLEPLHPAPKPKPALGPRPRKPRSSP